MVADDHFVCDTLASTQAYARECLCTAERSLRFMEHIGLQPSRNYRTAYLGNSVTEKLPNSDHATYWEDRASGQFILIDEPYRNAPDEEKRAAWAKQNGWRVIKSAWPGMYNPYACDLYVAGQSSYDLDALVAKINAMSAPLLSEEWPGESSPSLDTFVSPMAKTTQDKRRARCRGTIFPVPSATTIPYRYDLGSSPRRPAGELGVDGHIEAGRILKAALRSRRLPDAACWRLESLRSTLEDWMSLEIGLRQLENFEVYYGEAEGDALYRDRASTSAGMLAILGNLKQLLRAAYPDCAPLRKQIHRIDRSISFIGKTKSR
jgi:hypothetical protein